MKELFISQKETDRKFEETDRKFQETDRVIQETSREVKNTSREIKKVTDSIGKLGNRLGEFIEEMVHPAAVRLFRELGIDVHEVHRGVEANQDGDNIEIDLLVVNSTDVVAVECKSLLSIDDVNRFLLNLNKLKNVTYLV